MQGEIQTLHNGKSDKSNHLPVTFLLPIKTAVHM